MRKVFFLISSLIAVSACASEKVGGGGYVAEGCVDGGEGGSFISVSENAFGNKLGVKVCVMDKINGVALEKKIRIISYKNKEAELEFLCDKKKSSSLFKGSSWKELFFVFDGVVVGSATLTEPMTNGRCAVSGLKGIAEAVSFCEKLSLSLSFPADDCYKMCERNDRKSQVCVWVNKLP
jgi:hypothetical protein